MQCQNRWQTTQWMDECEEGWGIHFGPHAGFVRSDLDHDFPIQVLQKSKADSHAVSPSGGHQSVHGFRFFTSDRSLWPLQKLCPVFKTDLVNRYFFGWSPKCASPPLITDRSSLCPFINFTAHGRGDHSLARKLSNQTMGTGNDPDGGASRTQRWNKFKRRQRLSRGMPQYGSQQSWDWATYVTTSNVQKSYVSTFNPFVLMLRDRPIHGGAREFRHEPRAVRPPGHFHWRVRRCSICISTNIRHAMWDSSMYLYVLPGKGSKWWKSRRRSRPGNRCKFRDGFSRNKKLQSKSWDKN